MAPHSKIVLVKAYALEIEPYHRLFSLEDKSIQYTYAVKETVPMWLAAVIVVLGPLVVMTITALAIKRSTHDWHHSCLGLFLSLTLTLIVTEIFKNTSGRPRPDLIDRCQPVPGSVDSPVYDEVAKTLETSEKDLQAYNDLLNSKIKKLSLELSSHNNSSPSADNNDNDSDSCSINSTNSNDDLPPECKTIMNNCVKQAKELELLESEIEK
ncbi:237_t:CDS:2, partial [Entrophospora sp. SA101]